MSCRLGLSKPCHNCPVRTTIKTGAPAEAELTPRNQEHWPDEQGSWLSMAAPVRDKEGRMIGVMETAFDLTERERANDRLRESETLYRDLVEHAQVIMCTHDPQGFIQSVNPRASALLGIPTETLLRMNMRDIVASEKRDGFDEYLKTIRREGKAEGFLRVETHDGQHRIWEYHNTLCTEGVAEPIVRGTAYDVTENMLARKDLKKSRQEWKTIFQAIGHPSLILDPGFHILEANRAAVEAASGLTEHLRGKHCFEVFCGASQPPPNCPLNTILETGEFGEAEVEMDRLGKTFLIACTPITDEEGNLKRIIHIATDITEQKKAEQRRRELQGQLFQAQKMEAIGTLAGGIAHDFNNLLSIIIGYGDMMLTDLDHEHPHYPPAKEIHSAAIRAKNLTRQLLAFSRKQVLAVKIVDVNDAVNGFEKLMRRLINEDIILDFKLTPEPARVKADISQLEQVLMNLVVNARDAMPDGGMLFLETALVEVDEGSAAAMPGDKPGRYVMIGVRDTGVGMESGTLEKIFEPFFTTKEKEKGTGLGLSTVYGIVKQHGGDIRANSTPGKGTTFKIYLPEVADEKVDARVPEKKRPKPSGSRTILVVEDDQAVRKMTCAILKENGYRVLESSNPEDAVAIAEKLEEEIHLLLADVVMPHMKGPEVYRWVSQIHTETRVLYMSGYSRKFISQHGISLEKMHLIHKPFTVKGLVEKVEEVLNE